MSRFSICRMQTVLRTLWVLAIGVVLPATPRSLAQSATTKSATGGATAKSLFCAYGPFRGEAPYPPPPEFYSEFAEAVVEIDSPSETRDAAVSGFTIFDEAGDATESKRVVSVEVFNRPRVASEGELAYYLNPGDKPGDTPPWNGTLPAGRIQLRIRVELAKIPLTYPVRYRLKVGQHVIEGSVECAWPT